MIWVEPEPKNTALGRIRPKLQMTLGLNVLLPMVFFPFPDWGPRLFCCNSCLLQDLLGMPRKAVRHMFFFYELKCPVRRVNASRPLKLLILKDSQQIA